MPAKSRKHRTLDALATTVFSCCVASSAWGQDSGSTKDQLLLLQRQNQALQQQLESQQKLIEALSRKVDAIQEAPKAGTENHETQPALEPLSPDQTSGVHLGKVAITGQASAGFFNSEPNGSQSKGAFRVDEARLFLDAPVWDDVYFFTELDFATGGGSQLGFNVEELYVDFEDVSKLWGRDKMLNIKAGHFNIPFGEEYLNRYAMQNPLISHSVSDLWGVDDGVEVYGSVHGVSYVAAVQNGGNSSGAALQSDKSVSGKIGYDPAKWLHLSVSGMRTGNLSVKNGFSASWFGNGFFNSLGSSSTTTFHDNLVEADFQMKLPGLKLAGAGGYINYGDNDPMQRNRRDVYYYFVEGTHDFNRHFYAATRFSEVFAHNGFPIVGSGSFSDYQFSELTTEYWRLSLGLGYRFSDSLIVKGEYYFNNGRTVSGSNRDNESGFAMVAAFSF